MILIGLVDIDGPVRSATRDKRACAREIFHGVLKNAHDVGDENTVQRGVT